MIPRDLSPCTAAAPSMLERSGQGAHSSLRIKGGGFIRSPLPDDSITVRRKQSCLPPQRAAPAPLPAVALSWILSPALGASGSHDSYFPGRPSVGILFEFGVLVCM